MLRLLVLPLAAWAAEVDPSTMAPPPLEQGMPGMTGMLGAEEGPYQELVAAPLHKVVDKLEEVVEEVLDRIAASVSGPTSEMVTLREMGPELRKVLGTVVPELLLARDNSSSVDIDYRPSARSKATYAQKVLLRLQTYTTWAWPVLAGYSELAFAEEPMPANMIMRMQRGTNKSLQYLSSVPGFTWTAAQYTFPVVQDLMNRTDSSGEVLVKAGCAANYAQLLGDITEVYSDLSNSKIYCFGEKTNKSFEQICAKNSMASLRQVTRTISEASNAMWQCFGLYWGCSQLMNSAYQNLAEAYSSSFILSQDCTNIPVEAFRCKSYAFQALGSLTTARGLMQSAVDDCDIRGGSLVHPLNPWAATPFEPKANTSDSDA